MIALSLAGWFLFALPGGESPPSWTLELVDESPEALPQESSAPAAASTGLEWLEQLQVQLYGNFLGNRDDERINDAEGNQIDDRMRLREVDIDFRYEVSETVRGAVILSYESDPVNEHEADLAEGWIGYHRPFGAEDDFALELRAGKFRTGFGQNNRLRIFDIPQPTRPLPVRYYLGEDGLTSTGFSGDLEWTFASSNVFGLHVDAIDSGDLPLTDAAGEQPFATVVRLGWLFTGELYEIDAGLSSYEGRKQPARLNGADFRLSRRPEDPDAAGTWHLGGELFEGQTEFEGLANEEPQGWYAWGMVAVLPRAYVGVRVDAADEVADADQTTRSYGIYGTYVASEHVRVAVGWEHFDSDVAMTDGLDSVYVEINFALGSSPAQPFWVR